MRLRPKLLLSISIAVLTCAGLISLGVWQLERRVWKLELIERVTRRVHAPPEPAPGPDAWSSLAAKNAEYRHVRLSGRWLNDRNTLVKAVTELGGGYWVLTPLHTADGFTVLVNRGFVPTEYRNLQTRGDHGVNGTGESRHDITVTGLLRLSEPGGAFLRHNDPHADRWYSRDVAAIASTHGLNAATTAPYFVDADASVAGTVDTDTVDAGTVDTGNRSPVGGLTVIHFHNNHLVYAITWFSLALMPVAFILITIRREQ